MREIYNWSKLDHDNIHKLLGVIVFEGRLGMVSKWMEEGNLRQYLQSNARVDRYPLCIQVAQGVEYLHDNNMIHGDLKAINVLVSSDHILKLTDFDHSIMAECTSSSQKPRA
ncbi:kinase-like domain-containing protein [Rhizoctonia solani]|nr:kinase-like domain-containing protein [Rhizoctonia solani]